MSDDPKPTHIRLQTAADKAKQKRQYEELMRSGQIASALIIAELTKGRGFHVLGQGMTLEQMTQALFAAVKGVAHAAEQAEPPQEFRLVHEGIGQTMNPEAGRENVMPPIGRKVRLAEDGTMQWPKGETAIRCGECNNPSFFVALYENSEFPARFACCKCGNEIEWTFSAGSGTA